MQKSAAHASDLFSTYEVEGAGNALEILSFKNGLCPYFLKKMGLDSIFSASKARHTPSKIVQGEIWGKPRNSWLRVPPRRCRDLRGK